jgi:fatty acid-binding protein DegV
LKRLAELAREWGLLSEMAVLHTGTEESAQDLTAMLRDLVPTDRVIIGPASAAVAVHLGLGAVGICALLKE